MEQTVSKPNEVSNFVDRIVRPLTRRLNPSIMRVAGGRWFPMFSVLHHRGHRSGRIYATPISAMPRGEFFWLGLSFGQDSGWARNVLAAGECAVRLSSHRLPTGRAGSARRCFGAVGASPGHALWHVTIGRSRGAANAPDQQEVGRRHPGRECARQDGRAGIARAEEAVLRRHPFRLRSRSPDTHNKGSNICPRRTDGVH